MPKHITELPADTAIVDADVLPIVSDAATKKVTAAVLAEYIASALTTVEDVGIELANRGFIVIDSTDPRLPDDVVDASMPYEDAEIHLIGAGADRALGLQAAMTAAVASDRTLLIRPQLLGYSCQSALTVPTGLKVVAHGVTLLADRTGNTSTVMDIANVSNVRIEGLTIDGKKASYAPATEHRHGIKIINSDDVTLVDVRSHSNKGDGVYVGDHLSGGCTDVTLTRVDCDANHRNGLSVTACSGFKAVASKFRNSAGTAPQAGADVEPNTDASVTENIKFVACDFTGNTAYGLVVSLRATPTGAQEGIDLLGCTIEGNTTDGLYLNNGYGVTVTGGEIKNNGDNGVRGSSATAGVARDVTFTGVTIKDNAGKGIEYTQEFDRLAVIGCSVKDNGTSASGTLMGIDLSPTAASVGARIIGTYSGGASQSHGLRTGVNLSKLRLAGNSFLDNATAPVSLSDDLATRVVFDTEGINTQGAALVTRSTTAAAYSARNTGDTQDRVQVRSDGVMLFSNGSATADVRLQRRSTGVLGMNAQEVFRHGAGTTAQRPTPAAAGAGAEYFDTTLVKPIWSTGAAWIDATGLAV